MINCGDFMNYSIIFLVFVGVLELMFYIQNDLRAMATLGVVALLFGLIFFLYFGFKGGGSFISNITGAFKPPHQRVKTIVVGNQKASNNTIVRIKEKNKKVSNDEGDRGNNRNTGGVKDSASCIIDLSNDIN
jgi:hypothetical protein